MSAQTMQSALEKLFWALLAVVTSSLLVLLTSGIIHFAISLDGQLYVFDKPLFIHLYLAVAIALNTPFQHLSLSANDMSFFEPRYQPLLITIGVLGSFRLLGRVALLYISPSLYTAIVLLGVPTTQGLRRIFLADEAQEGWSQLLGLLLVFVGLVTVVGPTMGVMPYGMAGIGSAFTCMMTGAMKDVAVEVAIKRYGVPKGYAQGAEGVYGVPVSLAVLWAAHTTGWEDSAETYLLLRHAPMLLLGLLCAHFVVEFTWNLSAASVTKQLNATWKNILKGCRIPAVMAVELCFPQFGGPPLLAWQTLGVLLIAVGVPMYAWEVGAEKTSPPTEKLTTVRRGDEERAEYSACTSSPDVAARP